MNTYPEMNKQIVALLKASGTTVDLYAAARIEELEKELKELENPPFATWRRNGVNGDAWSIVEEAKHK